jgi:hypothetical protein
MEMLRKRAGIFLDSCELAGVSLKKKKPKRILIISFEIF